MKRRMILAVVMATTLYVATAEATTHGAYSVHDSFQAVSVPGLEQRHLRLDPGATFAVEVDSWQLVGGLTSATDASKWLISMSFQNVLSGSEFGVLSGFDDARLKGTNWANQHADWAFAETVTGTLSAIDGEWAGHSFSIERNPGSNDYWAQFGTCLSAKNCDLGLSTWFTLNDKATGAVYTGDIDARISAPVPEPSALLLFGLGTLLSSSAIRSRRR